MPGNLTGWHLVLILVVILLLFGAAKLPALAKSVGQSARVFRGEMKAMKAEDVPGDSNDDSGTSKSTVADSSAHSTSDRNPPS